MAKGKFIKTPENVEKFINLVIMGVGRSEVEKAVGIKPSTYYAWLSDEEICDEIEKRRFEIKDEGLRFIKGRYKKYLANIDKLANNFEDKRTALASNQWILEKLDGKNTAKIEIENREIVVDIVDDDE